jgi:hypothetical protein
MGEDPRDIERQIEDTREHMGDTVSALSYKADVPTRVKDSIGETKDSVVGKVTGTAGGAASGTKDGAKRAVGMAQQNPLGLVIGAVAAGFLIGSLLPSTEVEDERIGPMASEIRGQVSDLASEAVDHGTQVVKDAADAATETAKDSAGEHAQELSQSAKESATETADRVS